MFLDYDITESWFYMNCGYKKTLEYYSDLISYGWEFRFNIPDLEKFFKKIYKEAEVSGIEVFIGTLAFDVNGEKMLNSRPVFIRKK